MRESGSIDEVLNAKGRKTECNELLNHKSHPTRKEFI